MASAAQQSNRLAQIRYAPTILRANDLKFGKFLRWRGCALAQQSDGGLAAGMAERGECSLAWPVAGLQVKRNGCPREHGKPS